MPSAAARRVAEYALDRLDDGLRAVYVLDADAIDVAYLRDDLRDDLRADYDADRFAEVASLFQEMPAVEDARLTDQPIGQREAVVHAHEHAVVLQLPFGDRDSILVAVEPDVGRELLAFIHDVRNVATGA